MLVDEGRAPGCCHEQRSESEQASGWGFEGDDCAAGVAGAEVGDLALAGSRGLGDGADVVVGDVDDGPLQRLVGLAVDLTDDDLGAAHLELETLAAHRFDEHGEL